MPMCPNCGGWIPEGDHTCQCGTSISYDSVSAIDDEVDEGELARKMLERMARNHKEEALRLENERRYGEAIERCRKSLEKHYLNSTVEILARLYYKNGEYDESIRYYERIKDSSNYEYKAYIGIGKDLAELGRYEEAFENFGIAIEKINERFSNDDEYRREWIARTYNEIGWVYNIKGEYEKAIKEYETGIGYFHDYAGNWNCKAIALDSLRRYAEALKFFDIALTIDVGDETILNNRRGCLISYGRAYRSGEYRVESKYLKEALDLTV